MSTQFTVGSSVTFHRKTANVYPHIMWKNTKLKVSTPAPALDAFCIWFLIWAHAPRLRAGEETTKGPSVRVALDWGVEGKWHFRFSHKHSKGNFSKLKFILYMKEDRGRTTERPETQRQQPRLSTRPLFSLISAHSYLWYPNQDRSALIMLVCAASKCCKLRQGVHRKTRGGDNCQA